MNTRKILMFVVTISFVLGIMACGKDSGAESKIQHDWNGGYYIEDNTRLDYFGNSHEYYIYNCPECGMVVRTKNMEIRDEEKEN